MLSYNLGIWLFAMRYWTLSKILEITLNKEDPDRQANKLALVTWIGVAIVFISSVLFSWLGYFGFLKRIVGVISTLLWTFSFVFLADALHRIRNVMKTLTDAVLIYNVFLLYAFAAGLAIFGQIPILVYIFVQNSSARAYTSITIFSNMVVFLF